MPSKRPGQRLIDIVANIELARRFAAGHSKETFAQDELVAYAVMRALEIISEASRRFPDDLKERWPSIDWRGLAAVGNVYRHDYDMVDLGLIWRTFEARLPELDRAARSELARLGIDPDRPEP